MLIAIKELKKVLKEEDVDRYYVEIDMNGALELALAPEYSKKEKVIYKQIEEIDKARTPDDISDLRAILHPVKRIIIDDDEYEDIKEKFDNQDISRARYSQQLNTWFNNKKLEDVEDRPPCVTFYSYKGGVGRSTALAVTARLLSEKGFKVGVIDLDLEAPGLNSLLLTSPKPSPFGVVDYLYQAPWIRETFDKETFMSRYIVKEKVLRRNQSAGELLVMSAGGTVVLESREQLNFLFEEDVELGLESNYLHKLSYIDFDLYARGSADAFKLLLEDMAKYAEVDIILLDARTGFSDVSGALLNKFSDVLSIHIQDNRQNREGIKLIAEHIDSKQLDNIIWSTTKSRRGSDKRKLEDLKEFIISVMLEKNQNMREKEPLDISDLPYHSDLENINASELKKHINRDRTSAHYKMLAERIMTKTGLNQKLLSYIANKDRGGLVDSLVRLAEEDEVALYISPRFLNEDIELFVGFPGSGKKSFKNYMQEEHNKEVEVLSFEEFNKKETGVHQVLSYAEFLDWNYEEATQAVCKWVLQSKEFFNWLINNEHFLEQVSEKAINRMRKEAEYELNNEIAEDILDLVFENNYKGRASGWKFIFEHLKYREGYVLPEDIIKGIKLYITNLSSIEISKKISPETEGLFAVPHRYPMYMEIKNIWEKIGEEKKEWIQNYDEELLQLIRACKEINFRKYDIDNIESCYSIIKEEYFNDKSKEGFEKLLNKAFNMGIISKDKRRQVRNYIPLASVYDLIEFD